MKDLVTKESLTAMLQNPSRKYREQVVGRALVCLLGNQTAEEQSINTTVEDNGIGFAGCDAYGGTLTAKSFLKWGKLLDWQLEKWTKLNSRGVPRLAKYHRQLNIAANLKQETAPWS